MNAPALQESLSDAITCFLKDLQLRNYSPRTISGHRSYLGFLQRFLTTKAVGHPGQITTGALTEFRQSFFQQPNRKGGTRSVHDQNNVLKAIKAWCAYLQREGRISKNPALNMEYARVPRHLPRNILTPQEAKKILNAVDISHARGYRDRTILEVFYSTGIRRNELHNLKVGDVNLEDQLLRINDGKGGKDRVVPLTQIACQFVETYIKGIRPQLLFGRGSDHLFLSWRGRQIDPETLGYIVKRYAKLAKIPKHVTPHLWRHTCATHLLKNDAKLRHVQAILGHASLASTERYLHLTINDLKEAHRKYHPREKEL